MQDDSNEIMTVEEVAGYLKVKPQTVYKWAQDGQIPGTKLGKEWRFRRRILDEWIDTAITLSKGGFDLLFQRSLIAVRGQSMQVEDIDRIIEELDHG
ncbi:MAG TPA: helix-turn-helix domain-containing protein [Candidatus Hydrogenedentes bacterium]|nr:helix-turn-helix domain-containing protein [Candidatus Hydrogenedentota bacterium]